MSHQRILLTCLVLLLIFSAACGPVRAATVPALTATPGPTAQKMTLAPTWTRAAADGITPQAAPAVTPTPQFSANWISYDLLPILYPAAGIAEGGTFRVDNLTGSTAYRFTSEPFTIRYPLRLDFSFIGLGSLSLCGLEDADPCLRVDPESLVLQASGQTLPLGRLSPGGNFSLLILSPRDVHLLNGRLQELPLAASLPAEAALFPAHQATLRLETTAQASQKVTLLNLAYPPNETAGQAVTLASNAQIHEVRGGLVFERPAYLSTGLALEALGAWGELALVRHTGLYGQQQLYLTPLSSLKPAPADLPALPALQAPWVRSAQALQPGVWRGGRLGNDGLFLDNSRASTKAAFSAANGFGLFLHLAASGPQTAFYLSPGAAGNTPLSLPSYLSLEIKDGRELILHYRSAASGAEQSYPAGELPANGLVSLRVSGPQAALFNMAGETLAAVDLPEALFGEQVFLSADATGSSLSIYEAVILQPVNGSPAALGELAANPLPPTALIQPVNAARLAEYAAWRKGRLIDAAWSPDGSRLVVTSAAGLYLYDTATWENLHFFEANFIPRRGTFSPDGRYLLAESYDRLRIWRLSDGEPVLTMRAKSAVCSPDGRWLALSGAGSGKEVHIRRFDTWELEQNLGEIGDAAAFSADSSLLITTDHPANQLDTLIQAWQAPNWGLVRQKKITGYVLNIAASPDRKTLAVASYPMYTGIPVVQFWDAADWEQTRSFGEVEWLGFSGDGRQAAVIESSPFKIKIHMVDVDDQGAASTLNFSYRPLKTALSPDWQRGAALAGDRVVIFGGQDGRNQQNLYGFVQTEHDAILVIGEDGSPLVLTGVQTTEYHLWDIRTDQELPADQATAAARGTISPDGTLVALSRRREAVTLKWLSDGSVFKTLYPVLTKHNYKFQVDPAFSLDGRLLAAPSPEGKVWVWQIKDGKLLYKVEHGSEVRGLAFSPVEDLLASVSVDGKLKLWLPENGQITWETSLQRYSGDLAFSPDGRLLAIGYAEEILFYALGGRSFIFSQARHAHMVEDLLFMPAGNILASGSIDSTVRLWGVWP
ncbi:MAG TPA: WD40 repeat domain-containing protein [Anaerolineaceae bacterium]|nr:WD40 repeat domain-containing protein [Anaerolineaceae bacterium]HPN50400.1 WD40 repeat domain-containing protein [Anaerolineaceae bacterium]